MKYIILMIPLLLACEENQSDGGQFDTIVNSETFTTGFILVSVMTDSITDPTEIQLVISPTNPQYNTVVYNLNDTKFILIEDVALIEFTATVSHRDFETPTRIQFRVTGGDTTKLSFEILQRKSIFVLFHNNLEPDSIHEFAMIRFKTEPHYCANNDVAGGCGGSGIDRLESNEIGVAKLLTGIYDYSIEWTSPLKDSLGNSLEEPLSFGDINIIGDGSIGGGQVNTEYTDQFLVIFGTNSITISRKE